MSLRGPHIADKVYSYSNPSSTFTKYAPADRSLLTTARRTAPTSNPAPATIPTPVTIPTSATPAPSPTIPTSATPTPADTALVDKLNEERLKAALAALDAQFGFQQGTLESKLVDLKAMFNTGMAENKRIQENTIRNTNESSVDRGIYHSGITAQNIARALAPIAEKRATLISTLNTDPNAQGTTVRDLNSQIQLLAQQKLSADAEAKRQASQNTLDLQTLIAMVNAGLQ